MHNFFNKALFAFSQAIYFCLKRFTVSSIFFDIFRYYV